MIINEYNSNDKLMRDTMLGYWLKYSLKRTLPILVLVVAFILVRGYTDREVLGIWGYIIALVVALGTLIFTIVRDVNQVSDGFKYRFGTKEPLIRVTFGDTIEMFVFGKNESHKEFYFEEISKVIEFKNVMLIVMKKGQIITLDKAGFKEGTKESLYKLIEEKNSLQNKKIIIK